jgi:predicted MFS family arabinose efflux permease
MTARTDEQTPVLTRGGTVLLAVIAGVAVANLYYVQPLLATLAGDFHVGSGRASLLVTATQVGFVAGLTLFGPIGDRTSRRTLLTILLTAGAAVCGLTAAAPDFWLLAVAMIVMGVCASAAQVSVPFAASLAQPANRGRVTGSVMSGLLIGILLARTVSGTLADLAGWRTVFGAAAVVLLILAVVARTRLPVDTQPKQQQRLRTLMLSIGTLVRAEPVLRHRMGLGFVSMFNFSAMWTSIAFLLARDFHYSEATIGVFGLVGAAGAAGAPVVGRFADRGHGRLVTTSGWLIYAVGWLLLWLGQDGLAALIGGLLVFDFAAQAIQISNQSRVYSLAPEARGRITTAYMVSLFSGGIVGSLVSGVVYGAWGWPGVCITGLVAVTLGMLWWLRRTDR